MEKVGKMKKQILNEINTRKTCPACLSDKLSSPIEPHAGLLFPTLPIGTSEQETDDIFAPFNIIMCNVCGLIMLRETIDPAILYKIFHSDGIGSLWQSHYSTFAKLIQRHHENGELLEIGAGQGKLATLLSEIYPNHMNIIDPDYAGSETGLKIHREMFLSHPNPALHENFDSLLSSHTLEHFNNFSDYFQGARKCLKKDGMLFTSVPNQEYGFLKGYGNQLNYEHPSVCTNMHWMYLHNLHGFKISEILFFRDHSVQFAAKKTEEKMDFSLELCEYSKIVLNNYTDSVNARISKVRELATDDKENWLFGASNFSQPLFMYGLSENIFTGFLDNSQLKHGKRLYGTNLVCRKPEDVMGKGRKKRVFINVGPYNPEVYQQLQKLDKSAEFVLL